MDFRISPDTGLVWTRCPACGQEVIASPNGWRRHQPWCPAYPYSTDKHEWEPLGVGHRCRSCGLEEFVMTDA